MGREIRRVPANWEHPKMVRLGTSGYENAFKPQHKCSFDDDAADWIKEFIKWSAGDFPSHAEDDDKKLPFWEWAGSHPDRDDYVDYKDEEPTWWQAYETVSEGTPVSPPFETKEELIQYLADNGDFWDQKRCKEPKWASLWGGIPGVSAWGIEKATAFVNAAWAPSMVMINNEIKSGVDFIAEEATEANNGQ